MMQEIEHMFRRAETVAHASGDTSTKVGAVLITELGAVTYECCNDLPNFVIDMPERRERPLKYKFVCHAESNLICKAARDGVKTFNATIVTTHHPCSDCAKLIVQAGIKEVFYDQGAFVGEWAADLAVAAVMLDEAGVKLIRRVKST